MGAAGLVAGLLVVAFPAAAERAIRSVLPAGRMTERIIALIEGLRHGLTVLRSPSLLAGTVIWSLVLWLTNALAFYVAFKAFDIPVGFLGALLMQGILVFGITVQLTPGSSASSRRPSSPPWRCTACPTISPRPTPSPITSVDLRPDHPARRLVARAHAGGSERPASRPAAMSAAAVTVEAHAKLNLLLRVLAREADGFHGLETLFCLLSLAGYAAGERREAQRGHDRGRRRGRRAGRPEPGRRAPPSWCWKPPGAGSACT